jgi:ABC transporter substrate binding protein
MIATFSSGAFVAKAATATIPIVFVIAEDAVRVGLVTSLARPGGNLTGANFVSAELVAKRLELLPELVPGAARVAVLVNPANAARAESTRRRHGVGDRGLQWVDRQRDQRCLRKDCASASTPFSSATIPSSRADGSKWSSTPRDTRSRRHIPIVNIQKSADL